MHPRKLRPMYVAVAIIWTLVTYATVVHGETTFYTQREGTPDDAGFAIFQDEAGAYLEQDFEEPEIGPLYGEVPELWFGELGVRPVADWNGENPPLLIQSSEFDQEGKIFRRALFPGFGLTVTPIDDAVIQAFGCWIFDDGGSLDSMYRLEVVEVDGVTSHWILENEIDLDHRGHEIEGFIGVISDVGIESLTITPVDPETEAPSGDVFEVDHWMVTLFERPDDECALCGDLDDDGDVDIDDYRAFLISLGITHNDQLVSACADLDGDGVVTKDDYAQFRECYLKANDRLPLFKDFAERYGKAALRSPLRKLHQGLLAEFGDWPPRKKHGPGLRNGRRVRGNAARANRLYNPWARPPRAGEDNVD